MFTQNNLARPAVRQEVDFFDFDALADLSA